MRAALVPGFAAATDATAIPPTRTCAGVGLPIAIPVDGVRLPLNGIGLREVPVFGIDLYVAALYSERPVRKAAALLSFMPRTRLVVHFLLDVGRDRLTESFEAGVMCSAPGDAGLRADVERLNSWRVDMRAGGVLQFTHVPGAGLSVEVEGHRRGTIAGDAFSHAFFSHWLGDQPPTVEVRDGLLGGDCG